MKRLAIILISLIAAASAGAVQAQPPPGGGGGDSLGADWSARQDDVRHGVKQGRYVSLMRVIADINRRTPGYQLDAGLEQADGRAVYRVRWAATGGRRIDYIVDAVSGAILSSQ